MVLNYSYVFLTHVLSFFIIYQNVYTDHCLVAYRSPNMLHISQSQNPGYSIFKIIICSRIHKYEVT